MCVIRQIKVLSIYLSIYLSISDVFYNVPMSRGYVVVGGRGLADGPVDHEVQQRQQYYRKEACGEQKSTTLQQLAKLAPSRRRGQIARKGNNNNNNNNININNNNNNMAGEADPTAETWIEGRQKDSVSR